MARRPARRAAAPVWRAHARVSASRSGGDRIRHRGCGGDLQRGRATAVAAPAAAHLVSRAASASASSVPSAARRAGSRPAHAAEANAKAREPIHDSSAASSSVPRRSTARLCVGLACERTAMLVVESRRIAHAGGHKRRSRSRDCQQTCRCARSARVLHCVATARGVRAGGAVTSAVSPGVVATRSGGGARAPQLLTGASLAPARAEAPAADPAAPRPGTAAAALRQPRRGRGMRRLVWRELYRRMRRLVPVPSVRPPARVGPSTARAALPAPWCAMHPAVRVASNSPPASPSAANNLYGASPSSSPSFAAARVRARCACCTALRCIACWALTCASASSEAARQRAQRRSCLRRRIRATKRQLVQRWMSTTRTWSARTRCAARLRRSHARVRPS